MRPPHQRRPASHLRLVAEGMSDRDIAAEWYEAEAGDTADRIVAGLFESIAAELSTINLPPPAGVDAAIIRVALRGVIVAGLRRNLACRAIAARERPELSDGNARRVRIDHSDSETSS